MVMNNRIDRRRFWHAPNLANQIGAMRSRYPQFHAQQKGEKVIFTGTLRVREDLPEYKVRIEYRGAAAPIVTIISPRLVENAPHMYNNPRCLCLYHQDNYKWTGEKLVANDIVPWTAAWIYLYEYWLRTGKWVGPEVPHGKKVNKAKKINWRIL